MAGAMEKKYGKVVVKAAEARGVSFRAQTKEVPAELADEWAAFQKNHPKIAEVAKNWDEFEKDLPDPSTLTDEDLAELESHW